MFLLVLSLTAAAVGLGLIGAMFRRDQSLLGLTGLAILLTAATLAAVYGILTA